MSNVIRFQPGEDSGLEPLGKYRAGRGISSTTKDVFDVLFEADEPLDVDTIATRTFARASGAAQGHARRVILRERESARRRRRRSDPSYRERRGHAELSLEEAWRPWIARLVQGARRWGSLLRDENDLYRPNPDKPPRIARADGSTYRYTREAWAATTAQDRAVGDVATMRMEAERLLRGLDKRELEHAISLAVNAFARETRSEQPLAKNAARALRVRIGWLLARPTTDASRAWLLHELVRRAYGSPPEV